MPQLPTFIPYIPVSHRSNFRSSSGRCASSAPFHSTFSTPAPAATLPCTRATPRASASPTTTSRFAHLQNGSDVRGVAADLDPSQPVTLPPEAVRDIAAAFVRRVAAAKNKPPSEITIAFGRDSRITGPALLEAAVVGAASEGASVTDVGLSTTPAMFMTTVLEPSCFDCACMLTASHLPPNRNGIKFFTADGSANKTDIKEILQSADEAYISRGDCMTHNPAAVSAAAKLNFLPVYADHLVNLIRKGCNHPQNYVSPLEGFNIVVDAGNGAAGFFADLVLEQLGANVYGQFLEPDGMFPNHVPNPEDAKAMAMTINAVKSKGADLGVIFDTDVDRSGVVDSNGMGINRNSLIALLTRIVLREHPGTTVVTDSVTSNGLARFIEFHGGKHFRYRKGYKNVIDKGIELNNQGIDSQLAIETSGHGAMKENYMLDDGAYLAVKIIIEMVRMRLVGDERGIGGLLDGLEAPMEEKEFRLKFIDKTNFGAYGGEVVEAFAEFATGMDGWTLAESNYEGFRVNVDEGNGKAGWLLLRQSLHDPLLALNVESEVEGGVRTIAKVLADKFFCEFPNVDISQLTTY